MRKDMITSAQDTQIKETDSDLGILLKQLKREIAFYNELKSEVYRYSNSLKCIRENEADIPPPMLEPTSVVEFLELELSNISRCNKELSEITNHLRLVIG